MLFGKRDKKKLSPGKLLIRKLCIYFGLLLFMGVLARFGLSQYLSTKEVSNHDYCVLLVSLESSNTESHYHKSLLDLLRRTLFVNDGETVGFVSLLELAEISAEIQLIQLSDHNNSECHDDLIRMID